MKTLSIGREPDCNIIIDDVSNVVSRRHAVLTISTFGSMTITDLSHNGTYVNGIRISQNVPFPVTRKDNVSFAHKARLDWALIPNPRKYLYYIVGGIVALLLVIGGVICMTKCSGSQTPAPVPPTVTVSEDVVKEKSEELKKQEQARKDSIEKAVQDSIRRAKDVVSTKNKPVDVKPAKSTANPVKPSKPAVVKCSSCGLDVDKCEYKGNHPARRRF